MNLLDTKNEKKHKRREDVVNYLSAEKSAPRDSASYLCFRLNDG